MNNDSNITIFSSRDAIRTQIINMAQQYLELQNFDFSQTSYLSYLVDILSVLSANSIYYTNSAMREFFLTKALQKDSVVNLAAMIGYTADKAKASTVSCMIELPKEQIRGQFTLYSLNSYILNKIKPFKVYSNSGVAFTLINDIVVTPVGNMVNGEYVSFTVKSIRSTTSTTLDIPYRITNQNMIQFFANFSQKSSILETVSIPSLAPYEFYSFNITLPSNVKYATDVSLELIPDPINAPTVIQNPGWTSQSNLFLIPAGHQGFVWTQENNILTVSFGNGIFGLQPPYNSNCRLTISTTSGGDGNVISGSIIGCDNITYQASAANGSGITTISPRVINQEPAINGSDTPTIDEIRFNAINSVSANKRLVSEHDYKHADLIVENLPIRNVAQILKRSDIKQNEIVMFSELNLNKVTVPTKNMYLTFTDVVDNPYLVKQGTMVTVDGEDYYTMFDLSLNKVNKLASYYYYLDKMDIPVSLEAFNLPSPIYPSFAMVQTLRNLQTDQHDLYLELHFMADSTNIVADASCNVQFEWLPQDTTTYMVNSYLQDVSSNSLSTNYKFYYTFNDLYSIPDGEQKISFNIYDGNGNLYNTSAVQVTIKNNLKYVMYSQMTGDSEGNTFIVYDVPLILKKYYDNVDQSLFQQQIMQSIVDFDVSQYRMLTDFVNLKFSNTTGLAKNMLHNNTTRKPIDIINPCSMPVDMSNGYRAAFTDSSNPWSGSPWYKAGGNIAQWIEASNRWVFERISINDSFFVNSIGSNMIYTGSQIIQPIVEIPVQVYAVVTMSNTYNGSKQTLIKDVQAALIDNLYKSFGYDISIHRSQIIKIIQSVPGVDYCTLIKPYTDIFFNYDIFSTMDQTSLLRYSPELIYLDVSAITIEVH